MLASKANATRRVLAAAAPARRALAVNQKFTGNQDTFPKFTPKDNKSKPVDLAKHHKEEWSQQEIDDAIKNHSIFTWGASDPLRDSVVHVTKAEGVYVYDASGKKYLDWSAGAVCSNLGHTMPDNIKKAINKQMDTVPFVYGDLATHDSRARLSQLIADMTPPELNAVLFACGGSEANEGAIRMARRFTGRHKILSRGRSYHGGTVSSLAMTGDPRRWFVDGQALGFIKMVDPFPIHFSWADNEAEATKRCLECLHDQIINEGPHTIAAIFLESITGANGWLKTSQGFMQGVRALCDKYGIMMICDEVMCGFGRTGEMFGFQHFEGVVPDIFTFAKGVSSAYVPLSGIVCTDKVFDYFRKNPLGYGLTYNAHPLVCAGAYENLKYILDNDIVGHVREVEPVLAEGLSKLVEDHPSVKQARCHGLGGGFDLSDKNGNFLFDMHEQSEGVAMLKRRLREEGLITLYRGHHVHCTPPLNISKAEIEEGIQKLDRALTDLDEWVLSR